MKLFCIIHIHSEIRKSVPFKILIFLLVLHHQEMLPNYMHVLLRDCSNKEETFEKARS